MKIIYCITEKIRLETKITKANIDLCGDYYVIKSDKEEILLDSVTSVNIEKVATAGTMIKLINAGKTIFLCVPRLFIGKENGFLINNYFKTKKLGKELINHYKA